MGIDSEVLAASDGTKAAGSTAELSRRDLLRLGAAGTVGVALERNRLGLGGLNALYQQTNPNRPVRRNITTLSVNHPIMVAFRFAVKKMKSLPTSDLRSWHKQAEIHDVYCHHKSWFFFPWHRAYLYYFEEICREMTGWNGFAMPYWNWSKDARVPAAFWGSAANPLYNSTRIIGPSSSASSLAVGSTAVSNLLLSQNFLTVGGKPPNQTIPTGTIERTPHNSIHNFIGGDMMLFTSPDDPVFWAHHSNVERLWIEWNIVRGNPNPSSNAWKQYSFSANLPPAHHFVDRHGNPVTVTVNQMLTWPFDFYQYDTTAVA